jgi:hypothetical protein
VPDGTKIEQDYTTFDCVVLRKFLPVGNFVVHPPLEDLPFAIKKIFVNLPLVKVLI